MDASRIVSDPDFLAASPETKRAILTKHDSDFAAASPEMQTRIVEKYGAGRRDALISGADQAPALAQTDAKAATISNPPGTLDYVTAGLRQVQEETLPMLGLLAGGAGGTAVGGPAGGVGGAGLGYATGQAVNRFGKNVADMIYPANPDAPGQKSGLVDEAVRIGSDVLTGSTLDMLPPALLGVLRPAKNAVKGVLGLGAPSAETLAVRGAAGRQGIDLPAGAASGSTPVSAIESIPGRFPIGRQTSEPTYSRVQLQAQRAAERLQTHPDMGSEGLEAAGLAVKRDVGDIARAQQNAPTELVDRFAESLSAAPTSRIEAGATIREGMQGSQRTARARAAELYDAARAEAPADAVVPLTRTSEAVSGIASLETRLGALGNRTRGPATTIEGAARPRTEITLGGEPVPVASLPQNLIQQYGLDQPAPVPLDLAIELTKRVKNLGRATTNDTEKAQLREIANALNADIAAYGEQAGGVLGASLARASSFYRQEVARDFAPRSFIRQLTDMEPGRIAESVLTAQPDKVAAIMRQTPPAQRPMVQRMVFDRLRERSIDRTTGEIDPAKFDSALRAFGDDNLRAVFGQRVAELNTVRQTIRRNFGRVAEQPQGPGFAATAGDPFEVPMSAAPERIVDALTRGRVKSLGDFDAVYRTVTPETQRMIRASTYDHVLRQSFDNAGRFSIERFMTAKGRVPQDVWDRMLTAEPAAALADLQMVFGRLATHARAASNPSQTSTAVLGPAQVLGGMALTGSAAVGNEDTESFSRKLLGLMSPLLLGKAVFSRAGQRALTSQPGASIDPRGAISTLGKVLGIQLVPDSSR